MSLPLWDSTRKDMQIPVALDPMNRHLLTKNVVQLAAVVSLNEDLWSLLCNYDVLDHATADRIKLHVIEQEQIYVLCDYLMKRQMWRLHAFFKVLCETEQGHVVQMLGLDIKHYRDLPLEPSSDSSIVVRKCERYFFNAHISNRKDILEEPRFPPPEAYEMCKTPRGPCVIKDPNEKCEDLRKLFKKLDFDIMPSFPEMEVESSKEPNCAVLIVSDPEADIHALCNEMKSTFPDGVPKIVFVLGCGGIDSTTSNVIVPIASDFFIAYVHLAESKRGENGSDFIGHMKDKFTKLAADTPLDIIMQKVSAAVRSDPGVFDKPERIPVYHSTLRKNLFFFPGISADPETKLKPTLKPCKDEFYQNNHTENVYQVEKKTSNPCLIINVNVVEPKLPRYGTMDDAEDLETVFKFLDFNVKVYNDSDDLSAQRIKEKVSDFFQGKSTDKNFERCDCAVLILMSHGSNGRIYGTDGKPVQIDELCRYMMECKHLKDKPKLVFVQACDGGSHDLGRDHEDKHLTSLTSPTSPMYQEIFSIFNSRDLRYDAQDRSCSQRVPNMTDFLVARACETGHGAFRYGVSEGTGSWFMQAIVDVFAKYAATDNLIELMQRVNTLMAEKEGQKGKKQLPTIEVYLRKTFYFFPGIIQASVAPQSKNKTGEEGRRGKKKNTNKRKASELD